MTDRQKERMKASRDYADCSGLEGTERFRCRTDFELGAYWADMSMLDRVEKYLEEQNLAGKITIPNDFIKNLRKRLG